MNTKVRKFTVKEEEMGQERRKNEDQREGRKFEFDTRLREKANWLVPAARDW